MPQDLSECAVFEAWATGNGLNTNKAPTGAFINGLPVYADSRTHAAWSAWQEQAAEIARLTAELEAMCANFDAMREEKNAVKAERDALREDAERYLYLRNRKPADVFDNRGIKAGVWIDCENDAGQLTLLTGDDADNTIDAARKV